MNIQQFVAGSQLGVYRQYANLKIFLLNEHPLAFPLPQLKGTLNDVCMRGHLFMWAALRE